MTSMDFFKLKEEVKDRFNAIFKTMPDLGLSQNALNDKNADLIAQVINNFQQYMRDDQGQRAFTYLIDTCAYYIMLCSDMSDTNHELLRILEEHLEDDDGR
jgi:hypothetical protein